MCTNPNDDKDFLPEASMMMRLGHFEHLYTVYTVRINSSWAHRSGGQILLGDVTYCPCTHIVVAIVSAVVCDYDLADEVGRLYLR